MTKLDPRERDLVKCEDMPIYSDKQTKPTH